MLRIRNKNVLVTGASRGIGKAIAELFADQGANVIVSDLDDELGKRVATDIGEMACYLHLDVGKEDDWIAASKFLKNKFGGLDILVNNAGIAGILETHGPHDPENLDIESWRKVHQTNLDGVALGCKYGIRLMRKSSSASIVNISSRSGIVGIPFAAAYASSKAAVRNHTKSVALYCAEKQYPIRCNSIHPGAIYTPIWDVMLGEGEQRENAVKVISSEIPLGAMGEPIDVAYAALYLASDESKYVTGIELNVDGGVLAGSAASPPNK
ncbi:SDR family oxidoreductase [Gilvimarinus agarilyticus]|uniref:SDR family oxidoreductase n=1 Tax=Gammaproteobacteria TaxID=1236 RepID=UPI001C088AC9|nr:SDR family oxidoreductase [Gilvimarinus sp. 2_MG-2023]MBU2885641.1 SDR family oxidoreductase [Gilvimarinus agarilyticus]MDO6570503.1 SDR family oxidoreductase [Gilvimarinus sp. 2_MG-2023]